MARNHRASRRPFSSLPVMMEAVEARQFLSAAPHVTAVFADNRGQVSITVDANLKATTVNTSTVRLSTAGKDGVFATADDKKLTETVTLSGRRIVVTSKLTANTRYRILLVGAQIKSALGVTLDGEFISSTTPSGNGTAGGNYDVVTSVHAGDPIARFTTSGGAFDVRLFKSQVATTVNNFLHYANAGIWDTAFFSRLATVANTGIGVLQGGGYRTAPGNPKILATPLFPAIPLQTLLSNLRGTLAMARKSTANSAQAQWFFNTTNNPLLDAGGQVGNPGYAVFGQITNAAGLAVLSKLAGHKTVDVYNDTTQSTNIRLALDRLPVNSVANVNARGGRIDVNADLLKITRIAVQMDVVKR